MGESFLGLPNRFKIIDNLLESTYNPNHALSAYQGYRLATDYVNRAGGEDFAMTGDFHTKSLVPSVNAYYGRVYDPDGIELLGDDIGLPDKKYRNIYAHYLYGTAQSADKLSNNITLSVKGDMTGSVTFNGSGNIDLNVTASHNHNDVYLPLTGGAMTGNIRFNGYNIGLLDKNQRQILASDSSGTLHIGRGPYNSGVGNLSIYSRGYMTLYTKQDDIRICLESSTHSPYTPYVSIGADTTGAYIKYSKNAARLYLGNSNALTYNGYTVYHSGNLKLSDYSKADHTHDDTYVSKKGDNVHGNLLFMKPGYGIRDTNNYELLGYSKAENSAGLYDVNVGKGLLGYSLGGKTIIYAHKYPVKIYSKDTYEALRLNCKGPSNMVLGSTTTCAYFASEYYDSSSKMHRNTLSIPLETSGNLTYNGYIVYHSGNLKLSDYSKADHTHDYIPNSVKESLTSASHTHYPTNQSNVPTLQFLSYWNGAYNSTGNSNLLYCNRGKFGTIVTKNIEDFLASSGNVTFTGNLTISGATNILSVYKITPPVDRACVKITRTGSEISGSSFLDAAIDDLASDRIVPSSILSGIGNGSNGNITIGIDSSASSPGLYVKYVTKSVEALSGTTTVGASYTVGGRADVYCRALYCTSGVTATKFTTSSDIRLKEDIEQIDINQSIKILSKLSPVSYRLTENEGGSRNRGLIAQQLKEIMLEEDCEGQIYNESKDGGMLSIAYTQLIPDIINVLKYLLYKVDKDAIEDIAESLKFDENYYRENADEIAKK